MVGRTGPLLAPAQRVEFAGSQMVWEYYPGQGIELQVLGSFGKADGLYGGGKSYPPDARAAVDEMIPLAAKRGGGAGLGVLLQLRRRHAAVDQRDVAGDRDSRR